MEREGLFGNLSLKGGLNGERGAFWKFELERGT